MYGTTQCGALLERIQLEHHELNRALIVVRHRLATLKAERKLGPMPADVVESLTGFRTLLADHFATEEAGGCLEELAARAPSAVAQVRQIEVEHRELLPLLDQMVVYSKSQLPSTDELHRRFEAFAQRLHVHEAAESRVFQYVLGGEASDYDVEGNE